MFKVNDYVVYGATGVCQIVDIRKDEYNGKETEYYVLQPAFNNNMTIKTPVNNQSSLLRPILTKDEILSLIAMIPQIEPFTDDNVKHRSESLKAALKTGNHEELLKIIKTLYLDKQEKSIINKKLTKTDEDIMLSAEKQLHEEFAIALHISPDEVIAYIHEHIPE